jgi:alkyl hydroperoxide reductase subunit AhpF
LEGNVVVPGRTTLEQTLQKQKEAAAKQGSTKETPLATLSQEQIEMYVGGGIAGMIAAYLAYRAVRYILNRPTE